MDRRNFLQFGLAAASGLLVPEWILDPAKGRSQVSVVGPIQSKHFDYVLWDDLVNPEFDAGVFELQSRINLAFRELYEQQSYRIRDHYFKYGKDAAKVPLGR